MPLGDLTANCPLVLPAAHLYCRLFKPPSACRLPTADYEPVPVGREIESHGSQIQFGIRNSLIQFGDRKSQIANFIIFAPVNRQVDRFALIATTEKNAKPVSNR